MNNTELAVYTGIAAKYLVEYDLEGWKIEWNNQRRCAGFCDYGRRVLSFSKYVFVQRESKDNINTITHELAHALTPGRHHDHVWAAKHIELGGDGERCFQYEDKKSPYFMTCEDGCHSSFYRRPRYTRYICRKHRHTMVVQARSESKPAMVPTVLVMDEVKVAQKPSEVQTEASEQDGPTKFCKHCKTIKSTDAFARNSGTKDKLHTRCRACEKSYKQARKAEGKK